MLVAVNKQRGFTIVELLIVIVVIGILAAISIVAFNGIQQRARASAAQSALNQASKKVALYNAENSQYPVDLATLGIQNDSQITYQYSVNNSSDPKTYCITATAGNVSYKVSESTSPASGGCAGHGQGGQVAITNLAGNPSFETNTTGVSGYYSSPIVRDTTGGVSGVASAKTTTNSTINPQGLIVPAANPATAGTVYTCSLSVKGTAGYNVVFSGRPATAADGYISEGLGAKTIALSSSWVRETITITTPANTGILRVQVKLPSAATGVDILVDAVLCVQSSTGYNFADGNSPNWVWNGTPNNSTSTGPAL